MTEKVVIGDAVLYHGDCLEILPTLPKVDAVVTDPPYGIGKDGQIETTGGHGGRKAHESFGWDQERPPAIAFQLMLNAAYFHVIWGGNYFADLLPPKGKWLVWDKGQRIKQSDGELAWTSLDGALRIYTLNRVALLLEGTDHPTQKPVKLMEWCISQVGAVLDICDPFMGSGSTGIAAVNMGKAFYGIEREKKYFDIACERIDAAYKQQRLFA